MQAPKSIIIGNKSAVSKIQNLVDNQPAVLQSNPKIIEEVEVVEKMTNQTHLPHGIHIEDLDSGFMDWLRGLNFQLEGKLVPIHLYTLQRYNEFIQHWSKTDNTNTIILPIITVVKDGPAKPGTLLKGIMNVPGGQTYPLYEEIKMEGGKQVKYTYEISQPHQVDIGYRVSIFANHQRDINALNELMLNTFKIGEPPILINNVNMELKLDDSNDEHKTDIEERRYYHQIHTIILRGLLVDECDFKVKKSLNSISMDLGVCNVKDSRSCVITENKSSSNCGCDECYSFVFGRKGAKIVEHKLLKDFEFQSDNQPSNTVNKYYINCNMVTLPFKAKKGDILKIEHNASIVKPSLIKICGKTL